MPGPKKIPPPSAWSPHPRTPAIRTSPPIDEVLRYACPSRQCPLLQWTSLLVLLVLPASDKHKQHTLQTSEAGTLQDKTNLQIYKHVSRTISVMSTNSTQRREFAVQGHIPLVIIFPDGDVESIVIDGLNGILVVHWREVVVENVVCLCQHQRFRVHQESGALDLQRFTAV